GDVWLPGVPGGVILVVRLGLVEALERRDLRDDRAIEHLRRVELRDVRGGDALLVLIRVEDRGAVLPADVGALAVFRGRIVGDREEHLEESPVAELVRVVPDLHGLGMAGPAGAHRLVVRRLGGPTGVTRLHRGNTVELQVHGLDAPEAAARENGALFAARGRRVDVRIGELL